MNFLKFTFLSVCMIDFNALAMSEEIIVVDEGTVPEANEVARNHVITLALRNMDLLSEIKHFQGNDARKNNYVNYLTANFKKEPLQIFGNLVRSIARPFPCIECIERERTNANFYSPEGLKLHLWRNHNFCLTCEILFDTTNNYEDHCKKNHPFCEQCCLCFDSFRTLDEHWNRVHHFEVADSNTYQKAHHLEGVDPSKLTIYFADAE